MSRWILDVTDVNQGGKKIAESRAFASRDDALDRGEPEVLALNQFPPDIKLLYDSAIGKFTRDEVNDEILARFKLQFFLREIKDDIEVAPEPPRAPAREVENGKVVVPPPAAIARNGKNLSPRQLLQWELKELNRQLRANAVTLDAAKKQQDFLKERRDSCVEMLKVKPKPKLVAAKGKSNAVHG